MFLTAGGDQFSKLTARLSKTKIQLEKKEKKDGVKFYIFNYSIKMKQNLKQKAMNEILIQLWMNYIYCVEGIGELG